MCTCYTKQGKLVKKMSNTQNDKDQQTVSSPWKVKEKSLGSLASDIDTNDSRFQSQNGNRSTNVLSHKCKGPWEEMEKAEFVNSQRPNLLTQRVSSTSSFNNISTDFGSDFEGYGGFCSQITDTSSQIADFQGCSGLVSHSLSGSNQGTVLTEAANAENATQSRGIVSQQEQPTTTYATREESTIREVLNQIGNVSAETIPAVSTDLSFLPSSSEPPFLALYELGIKDLKKSWIPVGEEEDVLIEDSDQSSTVTLSTTSTTHSDELFYQMAKQMLVQRYGERKSVAQIDLLKQIFPIFLMSSKERKAELKLKILEALMKKAKDGSTKLAPVIID